MRTLAYVGVAVALVAFGALAIFSIGLPFVLTGVAMLAVMPWRQRPAVLWPAIVSPLAFTLGYVLIAPLGCTSSASSAAGETSWPSFTTCSNLIGIDYSGFTPYDPPLAPALVAGLCLAVVAAAGLHQALRRAT